MPDNIVNIDFRRHFHLQPGDRVLDLYAGTGSLGIEALSRDAAWADFVDQDAEPGRCIASHLAGTGLARQGQVYRRSGPAVLRGHVHINGGTGDKHVR